jgi:segregation and condensation protein B
MNDITDSENIADPRDGGKDRSVSQGSDQGSKIVEEVAVDRPDDGMDHELVNIVEAAIFSSDEPVGIRKLIALFPKDAAPSRIDIQNALLRIQQTYEGRGIELRRIGKGWRFQSREKYSGWLRQLFVGKAPRYSRALLETLAIIAYRQPVTRGDIEEVRGVSVSSETVRILLERDWVLQVGHRDVPGRPALFGTTDIFLQYFNLTSLRDLPELLERREIGEIASELNLTLPMDGVDANDDHENPDEHVAEVIPLRPDASGEPEAGHDATANTMEDAGGQTDTISGENKTGDMPDEGEDP